MKSDILVIRAGGVIDKSFPPNGGESTYNCVPASGAARKVCGRAGIPFTLGFQEACVKDGSDLTHEDREVIRQRAAEAPEQLIVITHDMRAGLHETAEYLTSVMGKTIVLTGARLPVDHRDSDVGFNIGGAITAVQLLSPGVYIVFQGTVCRWEEYVAQAAA